MFFMSLSSVPHEEVQISSQELKNKLLEAGLVNHIVVSNKGNAMAMNEEDGMDFKEKNSGGSGDLNRKQSPVAGETQYPNKSPRNRVSDQRSSGAKDRSSNKRPKKD